MTLPEQRPEIFEVVLQFMGHYQEKNLKLKIDLNQVLAGGGIVYEMVFDSSSGNWEIVVMYDSDRNVVGVADFTQS